MGHSKKVLKRGDTQKSETLKKVLKRAKTLKKSAFESKFTLLSAQKSDQKSGFAKKIFKSCSKLVSMSARNVGYGRPV